MPDRLPTLAEDPRLFLLNRSHRLHRLVVLKAPVNILLSEVSLVVQALNEVVKQEDFDVKLGGDVEVLLLRRQIRNCMLMLNGIPGNTLEERLTNLCEGPE